MPTAATSPGLTHRALLPAGANAINSCMPGYLVGSSHDGNGAVASECYALCKPAEAYAGNAAPQAPDGAAPHRCSPPDALGNFGAIPDGSATSNGEHCLYSWAMELDGSTTWHASPMSDTVGICLDHTQYRYDSNGNGAIDAADAVLPPCASLALVGTASTPGATDVGCVSSTTAGLHSAFGGKDAAHTLATRRLRLGIVLPELR